MPRLDGDTAASKVKRLAKQLVDAAADLQEVAELERRLDESENQSSEAAAALGALLDALAPFWNLLASTEAATALEMVALRDLREAIRNAQYVSAHWRMIG
jgi:hypothetical protein